MTIMDTNKKQIVEKTEKQNEHYEDYNFTDYLRKFSEYVSQKSRNFVSYSPITDFEGKKELRGKIENARQKKLLFSLSGYYPAIRYRLEGLGWVEKNTRSTKFDYLIKNDINNIEITQLNSAPYMIHDETVESENKRINERKYMSDKLFRNQVNVNIIFSFNCANLQWQTLDPKIIVSKFPQTHFCTKCGLNKTLAEAFMFNTNGSLKYPQGYILTDDKSFQKFTKDFRENSCFSLMRYIAYCEEARKDIMCSVRGTIPWETFHFAVKVCDDLLNRKRLETLGKQVNFISSVIKESEQDKKQWDKVLSNIFSITDTEALFVSLSKDKTLSQKEAEAKRVIQGSKDLRISDAYEGIFNVWVLKPDSNYSGYGIRFYRKFDDICRAISSSNTNKRVQYVIQKYIERPMLIFGVKFDLRVWFVVSNIHKIKIWVYQEGYVRFCSKPFDLRRLNESRHLTNVRIQKKYRLTRSPKNLPVELMWDFKTLKEYIVKESGVLGKWEDIMNAMQSSIKTVMQCALTSENIELRKKSFQLFGADFLIHENYEPCLIEVNDVPGLSPTTSIIAKKTNQLLTDLVDIVMEDRIAYKVRDRVGGFRLVEDIECREQSPLNELKSQVIGFNINDSVVKINPVDVKKWKKTAKNLKIISGRNPSEN